MHTIPFVSLGEEVVLLIFVAKMVSCCVSNCGNTSRNCNSNSKGITFHRLPQNPVIRAKWAAASGKKNWTPSLFSRICSVHFEEKDFKLTAQRRVLLKSAVPTLEIWKLYTVDSADDSPATNGSDKEEKQSAERLFVSAVESEKPETSREKKLLAENKRDKRLIAAQRLKVKRLQCMARRYRKKIVILKEMTRQALGIFNERFNKSEIQIE